MLVKIIVLIGILLNHVAIGVGSSRYTAEEADAMLPDNMIIYEDGSWVYNANGNVLVGCIRYALCSSEADLDWWNDVVIMWDKWGEVGMGKFTDARWGNDLTAKDTKHNGQ